MTVLILQSMGMRNVQQVEQNANDDEVNDERDDCHFGSVASTTAACTRATA